MVESSETAMKDGFVLPTSCLLTRQDEHRRCGCDVKVGGGCTLTLAAWCSVPDEMAIVPLGKVYAEN